jgi:streptomycin 6-kinase
MAGTELELPRNLVQAADQAGHTGWLETLPVTIGRLAADWSLQVEAPFQPGGQAAWVAPVADRAGTELVLKLAWVHSEALHEAEGLRVWAGNGAVRLHAVEHFPHTTAMLLERCRPGTPLATLPERSQDLVVTALLRRLWTAPMTGPFRPLAQMCAAWAEEFEVRLAAEPQPVDPGLAREGIALLRTLPTTADRTVLLATDLHAGNVLAAQREPWLVIDPKPYIGDPAYDVLQHLLNCDRLAVDAVGLAGRMADLLGLDALRLRRWLFARCVQESLDRPQLTDVARRMRID